jgi:NAD(P)-dependent dehydrogenase (short-subunit alcohol dehydrogenase family)
MATRTGRVALVTGGNRGLGRAVVEALAADGIDVVFTYRAHEAEAKEVAEVVIGRGCRAEAIQLDITQAGRFPEFTETLRATLAHWGRDSFDVLVNNAGFSGETALGATEEATLDQLFAGHFKGVYLLTQALATATTGNAPLLADNGRIVNFSTGLTRFATPPFAVYASMKGAIEVLTRYWALELGQRGISVNTIAPGPTNTDFAGGYLRDEGTQQYFSGITALGRVAQADDIGPAVAALVADGTAWITAQRVEASGGFRL